MSGGVLALFLIAALLLLAIGGLLAAADAALGVLSRADLGSIESRRPRTAHALWAIAEDTPSHVNALNFVRVVAETIAAVLITLSLAFTVEQLWLVLLLASLIMIGVTYVLVGSSPRSVGTHHPEAVVRFSARLVHGLRVVLGPVATGLIRFGDRVTPGRGAGTHIRDEQQLLSMVDQAAEQELLEEDDREYIHSVLEFGDTVTREVMVPRTDMVTIEDGASVTEALELMLSSRHSRIPVVSDDVDDIAGILYLRDVARFVLRRPEEAETERVTRIMKPAQFVPEQQKTDDLLRQMQLRANHLAMVVDEYGGIAGLVTMEDLIEEIVGEISDEHDRDDAEVEDLGDGRFRVNARLAVDELGEIFGIELDDDDVDTVGGLFTKALGRLAEVGDTARIAGIQLTAEVTERRRKNLVSLIAEPDPDPLRPPTTGSIAAIAAPPTPQDAGGAREAADGPGAAPARQRTPAPTTSPTGEPQDPSQGAPL